MITSAKQKLSTLAMLMLLAACSSTKPGNVCAINPPAWMMEPPTQTEFIEPLESLTLGQKQSETPQN